MNNHHGEETESKQPNRGWIIWAPISAFLGYLVWVVIKNPGSINLGSLLPWMLVLACPLMHLIIMRVMGGHGQRSQGGCCGHGQRPHGSCCGHSQGDDQNSNHGKPSTKNP
ncbi:MAG: DUF2933 domain-containing protein [Firmicutes bacterium]|nr:DUF2933 domain-containing protein [Bacillota bacterium]